MKIEEIISTVTASDAKDEARLTEILVQIRQAIIVLDKRIDDLEGKNKP